MQSSIIYFSFFFNDPATTEIYTLSLHDALPICIFTSGYIWLGVASLLTFFVAYMLILSWADFSYVQPASSVAYLVVALLGYFYLGEKIAPLHWAGIGVICLGVFVVGNTPPRTTEAR